MLIADKIEPYLLQVKELADKAPEKAHELAAKIEPAAEQLGDKIEQTAAKVGCPRRVLVQPATMSVLSVTTDIETTVVQRIVVDVVIIDFLLPHRWIESHFALPQMFLFSYQQLSCLSLIVLLLGKTMLLVLVRCCIKALQTAVLGMSSHPSCINTALQ